MASRLLKLLGRTDLLVAYHESVVRGGLYRLWEVEQHGIREGTRLFEHFYHGALFLYTVGRALALPDLEIRLLMSAFSIHDLNKLPGAERRAFPVLLADRPFIEGAIRDVGIPGFFPAWEEYYEDLVRLIAAHSDHFHHAGGNLLPALDRSRLGNARLSRLALLMKAADKSDLSQGDREKREGFRAQILDRINAFGAGRFTWASHSIAENRGILTNLIHNAVMGVLKERVSALPLLISPEGAHYLVPEGVSWPERKALFREIFERFSEIQRRLRISPQTLPKLLPLRQDGIKPDPELFALGLDVAEVWRVILAQVNRRHFKIEEQRKKCLARIGVPGGSDPEGWLAGKGISLFRSEEEMIRGEWIRAVVNFLKKDEKRLPEIFDGAKDPWEVLGRALEFDPSRYAPFNALQDRPFVLAANLPFSSEVVEERLQGVLASFLAAQVAQGRGEGEDPMAGYIEEVLWIPQVAEGVPRFADHLAMYCGNNHKQCCHCSALTPAEKWMSDNVAANLKVQQFSNRLLGGAKSEPKRHVCEVCKQQFFLEKLSVPKAREKALYLHFMPPGDVPAALLEAIGAGLQELLEEEDALFMLDDGKGEEEERFRFLLRLRADRAQGLGIPARSEALGHTLSLPFFVRDGSMDSLRILLGVEMGARLSLLLGYKCLVSEDAVSPLPPQGFDRFYIDGIPGVLEPFLGGRNFDRQGVEALVARFDDLRFLERKSRDPRKSLENLYPFARAGSQGPWALFHEVDRAIERNRKEYANKTVREILPALERLATEMERSKGMSQRKASEYLKEMAHLAWSAKIVGSSLERNALLDPLNLVFDLLRRQRGFLDEEAIRAQIEEELAGRLDRLAKQRGYALGRERRECVARFIDLFFAFYRDLYGGRLRQLLPDEKGIKAAYLCFLRGEIGRKGETSSGGEGTATEMTDQPAIEGEA